MPSIRGIPLKLFVPRFTHAAAEFSHTQRPRTGNPAPPATRHRRGGGLIPLQELPADGAAVD